MLHVVDEPRNLDGRPADPESLCDLRDAARVLGLTENIKEAISEAVAPLAPTWCPPS